MTPSSIIRKSLLIAGCTFVFSAGVFARNVITINEKLQDAFKHAFPDAEQVSWVETADRYSVNFKQAGVLTKVDYDKDGNFVGALRYYAESHLPMAIVSQLHKRYPSRKTFGVTEVTSEASVQYFIKQQDDKCWYTIIADSEGGMEQSEKYKKAL